MIAADPDAAQLRFAAVLLTDPLELIRAQKDPVGTAARYGVILTQPQIDRLQSLEPEDLEKLRDTMRANHGWFPEWGHTGFW